MKKSILATFLAGLVTLGAAAGDAPHKMEFRLEKADDGQTTVNIVENGQTFDYHFTDEDLKDQALLESRLSGLDEKTRSHVVGALQNLSNPDGSLVFVNEDSIESADGQKVIIVKDFRVEGDDVGQKHRVFVDVNGAHDGKVVERIFQSNDSQGFAYRVGDDDTKIEWIHDGGHSGHMVNAIEHMLKNAKLSPEQIEKLQKLLDEKR